MKPIRSCVRLCGMARGARWVGLIVILLGFPAVALLQSNPARALVEQGITLLEQHYGGLRSVDYSTLRQQATTQLETACAKLTECGFDVGGRVLDRLIADIDDGHTFRLSPNRYRQYRADGANSSTPMLGLKFAALPDTGALVVTRVKRESPALEAGIQRGDVLWQVNDRPIESFESADAAIEFIVSLEFEAEPIRLVVSTRKEPRRTLTLRPKPLEPWTPVYSLRPDGVAFINFFQFVTRGQIASRVTELMTRVRLFDAKAVIIDLRGSGGGDANETFRSIAAFLETSSLQFRPFSVLSIEPGQPILRRLETISWTGQMIVLVNRQSRSAAEYLAAGLQPSERVTIIGEPTAGVLNSSTRVFTLMDGGAIAITATANRNAARVTPDIAQTDDMAVLSRGRDLVLEQALKLLKK
jgi:carboxyl-terminal processing protease